MHEKLHTPKSCLKCCSEIAPPHLIGRFNQLYQVILTLFILVAQVINLIINVSGAVRWGWRFSLGFAFVPSFVLFLGGIFLPDSPNSLLERGHPEKVSPPSVAELRQCMLADLVVVYDRCCLGLYAFLHGLAQSGQCIKHDVVEDVVSDYVHADNFLLVKSSLPAYTSICSDIYCLVAVTSVGLS